MNSLSQRGRTLVESPPMAAYIAAHFERAALAWHPQLRPDGYIGLCIAENKMLAPVLAKFLGAARELPLSCLGYEAPTGNLEFRKALAGFMGKQFAGRELDPAHIVVGAGAGTVLENLFYALADPGEGVLVPTPSYAGFWTDLETRAGLELVRVDTQSHNAFALTIEALEAAYVGASCSVRALLLCSPDNPLGRVYSREELETVLGWASSKKIHVVVDEVYALSCFGAQPFVSAGSLRDGLGDGLEDWFCDCVHIVWGFSKDFGASGLRCGVLLSENQGLLAAMDGLANWAMVSGPTQYRLRCFLEDAQAPTQYIAEMRAGLRARYAKLSAALAEMQVPHVPASAGFFLVCDLRAYLSSPDWEGERALWERIVTRANLNLTPGEACRIAEPGFFRLCYAAQEDAALDEALRRLGQLLNAPP